MCPEHGVGLFANLYRIADAVVALILVTGPLESVMFSIPAGMPPAIRTVGDLLAVNIRFGVPTAEI